MMAAARQVMKIANLNTKIIPGHLGPIIGFKEIQQQLDMFTVVRERVLNAIKAALHKNLFAAECVSDPLPLRGCPPL